MTAPKETFSTVRQPLLNIIDRHEQRIARQIQDLKESLEIVKQEKYELELQKSRLIGFLAGSVDLVADAGDDTLELAESLAMEVGECTKARRRWTELIFKRVHACPGLFEVKK